MIVYVDFQKDYTLKYLIKQKFIRFGQIFQLPMGYFGKSNGNYIDNIQINHYF
jgi:hypothetical protein